MTNRAGQVFLAALGVVVSLASCSNAEEGENAAAKPVELARYLPEDTRFVQAVDVTAARKELDLPDDANALPSSSRLLPRPKSPEAQLFDVTSNAYPILIDAFDSRFNAKGASPLDGTLVRAAASGDTRFGLVSTAEPIEDIEAKLELADYSLEGRIYEAGQKTPAAASRFVADAGNGRIVFADTREEAQEILRRALNDAEPGEAAEALEPASGSVRLAITNEQKRSCVTAFAAAQEATDEGAALALTISGEKPDPDRFDPKALYGVVTGTPTVLVDALIVPYRVKRPLQDGLDPLVQVLSSPSEVKSLKPGDDPREVRFTPPPFDSYDCP